MFFVAKATLCIGLVAVVASQSGGESLATRFDGDARAAAANLGRACLASADCLRIGTGLLAAGTEGATALPEIHAPRRHLEQGMSDGQHRRDVAVHAPPRAQAEVRG